MKLSTLQVVLIGLGSLFVLVIAGVILFQEPLKGTINGIRADRLKERAQEAFEAERWDEASRLAQAAHYLESEDTEIILIVAQSLLKQRMSTAVDWWKLILDEPDLPIEELRMLTSAVLGRRELAEALPFLSRLVELDGNNPETRRLWLRSLEIQRRYGKVMNLVSEFAEGGSEDWGIHRAYMLMRQNSFGEEKQDEVIKHLEVLLKESGPLAINAARELATLGDVPRETRELATRYLKENAEDDLDRLYAESVGVKDGLMDEAVLTARLEEILSDPAEGTLEQLLDWAKWMDAEAWFMGRVDWETYRANGGSPDPYLSLLLAEGALNPLLKITETSASQGDDVDATHLYYRSVALERKGDIERARETLELSVKTVDPDNSAVLEQYLIRDGHWALLSELYDIMLQDNPEETFLLVKALGARYYLGESDGFGPLLDRLEMGEYKDQPDIESFLVYAHLLNDGFIPEIHRHLESLLVTYPEVFDFRLVLGVSYILQGRVSLAEALLEDMPPLDRTAPRYMRVAGMILGLPQEELLLPGELEYLLPRERYLISLRKGKSTR